MFELISVKNIPPMTFYALRLSDFYMRAIGIYYPRHFIANECRLSQCSTPMPKHELRGVHFVLIFSCTMLYVYIHTCVCVCFVCVVCVCVLYVCLCVCVLYVCLCVCFVCVCVCVFCVCVCVCICSRRVLPIRRHCGTLGIYALLNITIKLTSHYPKFYLLA